MLGNTLFYFEKVIKIIWRRTLVVGQQGSITNPKIYFPLKSFFYSSLFSSLSRIKVFKRHLKGYSICSSLFLIFFMIAMKKKLHDDENDSIRLKLLVRIYSFSYFCSTRCTHLNEHIRLVETPL